MRNPTALQKPRAIPRRQRRRAVGHAAHQVIQPVLIGLGEIRQHIARHPVLVAGMANAQPHAGIVRAQMAMD